MMKPILPTLRVQARIHSSFNKATNGKNAGSKTSNFGANLRPDLELGLDGTLDSHIETECAMDSNLSDLYSTQGFDPETIEDAEEFSDNYETGFVEDSVNSDHYKNHYTEISKPSDASVIEDLRINLVHLEDLHRRLQFVMGEVSSLIKRK